MSHYILELAIWIFIAFLLGCILGALARSMFGKEPAAPATGDVSEKQGSGQPG